MSLLEQALDRWAGAGAWYGLHADTGLGCLAAVNTIGVIRAARNRLGDLPKDVPVRPSGALASAKFNIAKHLHSWSHQRWLLRSALKDINEAIVLERQDPSGLLAVKASINRRLGNVFEAVNGLEHSLRVRRANGTPEKDLGASLSELGFACLFAFRARQGLKHCEDGVQRLRDAEADSTDLARALRKLAVAALVNGRVRDYREARDEADTLAKNVAAQDQVR